MKKMIALSMLIVSACAGSSGAVRSSAEESFAGPWHGALAKGEVRAPADFRFSGGGGNYQGFFWGRELAPIPLTNVTLGGTVHFEVPQLGAFDGVANGETIEGTFRDATGEGSFKLEKQIDWDDPRNVAL